MNEEKMNKIVGQKKKDGTFNAGCRGLLVGEPTSHISHDVAKK